MFMDTEKPDISDFMDEDMDLDQSNDLSLRRRTQNRISQRKHRQKLRQSQEEEPSTQSSKPNTKKNNELVWMRPNTISISKQQKRQKPPTIPTERAQSLGEDSSIKAIAPARSRAPSSIESGSLGSSSISSPFQRALDTNTLELMESIELSHDRIEDLSSVTQPSRLPTPNPDSPSLELMNGDSFLHTDGSGIGKLLEDDFDMLLMQYQHGDMFPSEMSLLDQGSSSSTHAFTDLQISGQHFDDTMPARSDTSSRNGSGCTPLHLAVERNHASIVKLLLESGTDVQATNDFGETALHWAARSGELSVVSLLLDHMLDWANARDLQGHNPLHIAVMEGHEDVVRLMIGRGRSNTGSSSQCRSLRTIHSVVP